MLLTLPFERPAIVEPAPSAAWFIGSRPTYFFRVTEVFSEVPVAQVVHCPACPRRAAGDVLACVEVACPCRERKAA